MKVEEAVNDETRREEKERERGQEVGLHPGQESGGRTLLGHEKEEVATREQDDVASTTEGVKRRGSRRKRATARVRFLDST